MKRIKWRPSQRLANTVLIIGVLVVITLVLDWLVRSDLPQLPDEILFAICIVALMMLVVLIGGYRFNWKWTGLGSYTLPKADDQEFHAGKTLWDWMQLLIIPAVLASGALLFNKFNTDTQNQIAADNQRQASQIDADNQRETALQTYFDRMSELLLDKGLRTSLDDAEIRNVARTRTLSVIRMLDGDRKVILLHFLYDSQLITTTASIISLNNADISSVNLRHAMLSGVNLSGANLSGAFLGGADLELANLSGANLSGADLSDTGLTGAILENANLSDANLSDTYQWWKGFVDLSHPKSQEKHVDWSYATLRRANLANADRSYDNFEDADLSDANLKGTQLVSSVLFNAKLIRADLSNANLQGADLSHADLSDANLNGADLSGADLSEANLSGANVTLEQLAKAKSLKGATMPDGTKHS